MLEVPPFESDDIIKCNGPLGIHRKDLHYVRTETYVYWVSSRCQILYQVIFVSSLSPTTGIIT